MTCISNLSQQLGLGASQPHVIADGGLGLVQMSVGVPEAFQIFYATGWNQATVLYRVLPRAGQAPAAAQVCPETDPGGSSLPLPCPGHASIEDHKRVNTRPGVIA